MKLEINSILFLGIGGVSMHQIAHMFCELGVKVYGYDIRPNSYTKKLEEKGAKITSEFRKDFCDVDVVVKTAAIKDDNEYIKYFKDKNIKIIDRAEILSWLCSKFKTLVAVAGTHGKSTTSSLIYHILRENGIKVSCHIGADVEFPRFDITDDILVVEACEYNKSFLSLYPDIAVVTNVEKDHMDCYTSMFELRNDFWLFLKRAGLRFVGDNESTKYLKKYKKINFIKPDRKFTTHLKGNYNQENIAIAFRVCLDLGVKEENILKAIKTFRGIPRRQEKIGEFNGSEVFIDYAHHPTEIKSFLSGFGKGQIVFQPHTFSRTKYLLKEFIEVLSGIDNVIIFKEYPARETKNDGISAYELYLMLKEKGCNIKYADSVDTILPNLATNSKIAFVGAGDINEVAKGLLKIDNLS